MRASARSVTATDQVLLLKNVVPSCSDEVPGQWHPYDISGNVLDGGDGVLLADLSSIKRVLQVPDSSKTFHYKDIISIRWFTAFSSLIYIS